MVDTSDSSPFSESSFELAIAYGRNTFSSRGAYEDVMAAFEAFVAEIPSGSGLQAGLANLDVDDETTESDAVDSESSNPPPPHGGSSQPVPPLAAFLNSYDLKGNQEIALATAVWNKRKNGSATFKVSDLETTWKKQSSKKVPANLARDLGEGVRKGWFHSEKRGEYEVTAFGEGHLDGRMKSGS